MGQFIMNNSNLGKRAFSSTFNSNSKLRGKWRMEKEEDSHEEDSIEEEEDEEWVQALEDLKGLLRELLVECRKLNGTLETKTSLLIKHNLNQ